VIRIALLATLIGCATTVDGLYLLTGPHARSRVESASLATGHTDHWREIQIDPRRGLACVDVDVPEVRAATINTSLTHPNGYKAATQFFTVVEVLAAALIVGLHEYGCATNGCGSRIGFYPYLAPLVADIAWGTYRSFTIHNEILRSNEITWNGPTSGETMAEREPCAVGTELALYDGGEQLIVHVGERGVTVETELTIIAEFVAAHASFSVGGEHVRLDATNARELAEHVRKPLIPAAATAAPQPSMPAGVSIDVDVRIGTPKR